MKNDFFKLSSKRILFSTMMASALLAVSPQSVFADVNEVQSVMQTGTVKGQVVDANGEPIIGASVLVKGTTNGTITDFDGNFSLNDASKGTLVISYIGYQTQEVSADGKSLVKVVLKEDTEVLDEVVVVGYGVQKKATLTGAVSMINADETLKGRATTNVASSLQGTIPGLTITRTTSRPTEDPALSLRGGISTNDNKPLILIDGSEAYTWELNTINPNDIENVSVLKDASASIYGARAAGGVILITTKRGKAEKLSVTYNGAVTANFQGKRYPAASGSEWAKMMLSAAHEDINGSVWAIMDFTKEEFERVANNEAFDWTTTNGIKYRIAPLNAYQPDYVYGTTWSHNHNLSISGGSERIQTKTSIGFADDRSIVKVTYDGQKKYNFRNNTDFKLGDYVKLATNIAYDNRYKNVPSKGIGFGLQDFYIFPLYTEDGTKYYDNFGGNNVLAHLTEAGRTKNKFDSFRLGGKIDVDLSFLHSSLKGLSVSAKANVRQDHTNWRTINKTIQMYDYYTGEVTNNAQTGSRSKTPQMYENNSSNLYQDYEFFLNYDRTFDNHHIAVMFGNTNELRENRSLTVHRTASSNQELEDLSVYDASSTELVSHDNWGKTEQYKWAFVSFLGRVNYDYAGKYMIEGTWRRDGSSKLVKEQRWQNFYGVSGGWRISEENFIKDNISWLNNLKIRASWGEAGNLSSIGNYESFATIGIGTTIFGTTPGLANTAWIGGIVDDSRTWERVETTNIGLDWGLFNNRLSGSFEYYWRKNKGMLMSITYPKILGATAPATNSGTYKANGWELSLNWQDHINKDWSYNVGFILADAKTEIASYEGAISKKAGVNKIVEGYPMNSLWVYKSDGLFQSQSEVDAYYSQMTGNVSGSKITSVKQGTDNALTPGSVHRVDLNGDKDITVDDLYYYGDMAPHYTFGINLGLTYKNFDFSAFFQGVGQQYNIRSGQMGCAFWSGWTNTNGYFLGNTWTSDDNPYYPGNQGDDVFPVMSRNGNRNTWNYKDYNDLNVINNWYVRCKSIQLGYTLPKNWISKVGIQNLRVWVAGENLFDISNVKDGFDPEANYEMGAYNGLEVFSSSVSFGLDITF